MTKRNPRVAIASILFFAVCAAVADVALAEAGGPRGQVSRISVPFTANAGQADPSVAFYAPTLAGTVFVTRDGRIVYSLGQADANGNGDGKPRAGWSLTETALGKNAVPEGGAGAPTRVSVFHGDDPSCWRADLPTFESVRLGEPWPGITLELQAHGREVEKRFTIAPGADASRIRMRLDGARALRIGSDGALLAETGIGNMTLTPPLAYQEENGARRPVSVAYRVRGREYGFSLGAHDRDRPVVVDPILQASYLGGTSLENQYGLTVDAETGDVIVTGQTQSTDFPGVSGGAQPAFAGLSDAFVARLDAGLTTLRQATYLGGSGIEIAYAAVVDGSGDVLVTGETSSSNFPGTTGGAQPTSGGGFDAFIVRLNGSLTAITQATYFGGNGSDYGFAIHFGLVDGLLIAGQTDSTNLPGRAGGGQPANGGGNDGFVALLSTDLTTLTQSTYIGGSLVDYADAIEIDVEAGEVFVAGLTDSTDLPGTTGGAQPTPGGSNDAFIAKFNASLQILQQSTYLGGSNAEYSRGLAFHPSTGELYIVGQTGSSNFPGTAGGAQSVFGGQQDAFVARLSGFLTTLNQATYFGGFNAENGYAIAFQQATDEPVIAGDTASTDIPGTTGGAQPASAGGSDAFLVRFNAALTAINQATYLGGSGFELGGYALAINPATTDVYYAGATTSTNFPRAAGGAQATNAGGQDAFIARLTADLASSANAVLTISKSAPGSVGPLANLTYTITYGNAGGTAATGTTISDLVPANTTFVSATNGGQFGSGTVIWDIGTVAAGASGLTVSFTVQVPASGTVDNNVYSIQASNAPTVDGTAVSTTIIAPILTITKTAATTVPAGTNLTYTLTYGNAGSIDANGVFIQDAIPAGTVFVSATGGGSVDSGFVDWFIGTVPAGASGLTVSFTVLVASPGGTVDNVNYSISAPGVPAVAGPPVSTQIVSLTVTKSAPPDLPPGANLVYTLTYGNVGASDVTGVQITDVLPTAVTFVSATGGGVFGNGMVTWNIGTVPAGATGLTVSFTVSFTATSGSIVNANYGIAGTGVPATTGPPVTTTICGPPTAAATASRTSICPGSASTLHGTGGTTCVWTPATGLSNPNSCSPVARPTTTTTYSLRVSSVCGISSNTATVTITVTSRPAGPEVAAPSQAIAGQFGLAASIVNPDSGAVYAWAFSPSTAATITFQDATSILFTVNTPGPLTLSVVETGDFCASAATVVPIDVHECTNPPQTPTAPVTAVTGNPTAPVTGVDFLDLSWTAPASPPAFYLWALNGNPEQKTIATSVLGVPPTGSSDPITLHVRSACSDDETSDVAEETVSPSPPGAAFSVESPVAPGALVTFTDTSTPGATSWLWLFGDRSRPGTDQSVTHAYAVEGTYTVFLIASNGAGSNFTSQTIEVDAGASQPASANLETREFENGSSGRRRLREIRVGDAGIRRLHVTTQDSKATVVFLRFLDSLGAVALERRLSIAPGQEAVFDLNAYGLRGDYDLELVSLRPVTASVVGTRARQPRDVRRPDR